MIKDSHSPNCLSNKQYGRVAISKICFQPDLTQKNVILRPKKARDNGSINNFKIYLAKPIEKAGNCKKRVSKESHPYC